MFNTKVVIEFVRNGTWTDQELLSYFHNIVPREEFPVIAILESELIRMAQPDPVEDADADGQVHPV